MNFVSIQIDPNNRRH